MGALEITLVVLQIILSLILVVVVLFQHGTQYGLSGSIAGGAETFFGKNSGRTLDAKLKKLTGVVAILFLVCSIALAVVVKNPTTSEEGTDFPITDDSGIQIDPGAGDIQGLPGLDGEPVIPGLDGSVIPDDGTQVTPDEGVETVPAE